MKIKQVEINDSFYPVHILLQVPVGNSIDLTAQNIASWFVSGGNNGKECMISVLSETIKQPIAARLIENELAALTAGIMANLLDPSGSWAGKKINVWIGENHVIKLSKSRKPTGIYKVLFHPGH